MNKPWLVIAGVVVVAGIVSGSLWRGLHRERLLNEELSSQLAAARTAAHSPALVASSLALPATQTSVPSPSAATCTTPAVPRGMTPMEQDAMSLQIRASTSGLLDGALLASTAGVSEQDLMKDPEYRKAELLQLRMKLSQSNPGLADALGITDKEANKLFEAMAEDQLKRTAEMAAMRASGASTANVLTSALQRGPTENPVRGALGEEKFAKYQDYQRTVRPALVQVAGIGSMLTATGQPLSDAQARGLASAMLSEQQRQMQEPAALPRRAPASGIVDILEQSATRQEEANRRILESAGPVLDAAQLAALRKQYEQEAATRRQTLESTRQREAARPTLLPGQ